MHTIQGGAEVSGSRTGCRETAISLCELLFAREIEKGKKKKERAKETKGERWKREGERERKREREREREMLMCNIGKT